MANAQGSLSHWIGHFEGIPDHPGCPKGMKTINTGLIELNIANDFKKVAPDGFQSRVYLFK